MRILFIGDIVGRSGRAILLERLAVLVRDWKLDFVAINGENSAGGFGITEAIYQEFVDAGADVITGGNHSWDQKEALVFIERAPRLLRPINYPDGTPGRGAAVIEAKNGARVLVLNAMGRIFMDPLDDPFAAVERELAACPLRQAADAIIVDIHGEATSEKQAMGFFCDGRASLVVGTHTHAPTADHQILPRGTAFISDVGMTGDYDSVIGMNKEEPLSRFLTKISGARFEPATGEATFAPRGGAPAPATNPRLRAAVIAARAENMPKDNIDRAIKKATGGDAESYDEIRYEGYGPGGVAVIVEVLTDNRNRTAGEVRATFTKSGGHLAETGAVSFMFDRVGVVEYDAKAASADAMLEAAIDAGAEDAVSNENGHEIYTTQESLREVAKALEAKFGEARKAALVWKPQNTVAVNDEQGEKLFKLIETLNEHDDVQNVYANFEISDALMQKL